MTKPSKLDSILDFLQQPLPGKNLQRAEAKSAIKSLCLEMVGKDEPTFTHTSDHEDITDHKAVGRNQLRAELRAKIEEL